MTHRAHPASGRAGEVLGIQTPEQKQRGDLGRRDGQHQSRSERVSRLRRPPDWYCPLGQKRSTARRGEMGPPTAPTVATAAASATTLTIAATLSMADPPDSAAALPISDLPDSGRHSDHGRRPRYCGRRPRQRVPGERPRLHAPRQAPPATRTGYPPPAGYSHLGAPGRAPPAIANAGRLAHNAAPRSRTSLVPLGISRFKAWPNTSTR